jgi:predicted ABC-type transport system involved in lysophospholipase L1 biosynthesis ATPase subunit
MVTHSETYAARADRVVRMLDGRLLDLAEDVLEAQALGT